jgi:hypothetical protein
MAVDKRSEEAAVNESGNRYIIRPGSEVSDYFTAAVKTFELMSLGVLAATTETVR